MDAGGPWFRKSEGKTVHKRSRFAEVLRGTFADFGFSGCSAGTLGLVSETLGTFFFRTPRARQAAWQWHHTIT